MKKKLLLFLFAMLTVVSAWAKEYHYYVDGIYCEITSSMTAKVTYRGDNFSSYSDEYIGNVVIPATINLDGQTYTVTSIDSDAFKNCSGLTSVTIPSSVTSIGREAFSYCSGLTSVIISEGLVSIGTNAFYKCSGLTHVEIPSSVTKISPNAFSLCSGLTSVTIPSSVTFIGNGAFYGCSGLTNITIPESVTTISDYLFEGCSGLTSITIPENVTKIGHSAFYNCSSLTSVYFNAENCTEMGDGSFNFYYSFPVFSGCSSLAEITIGEKVQNIPSYAFYECGGLTSITIPESVTSIGEWAFADCSDLTSVDIPSSVTSIGDYAFERCSDLTSIIFENSTPPSLGNRAFCEYVDGDYVVMPNLNIYVPKEAVNTYKKAWPEYADIIFAIPTPTAVDDIKAGKSPKVIKTIENGQIVIIRDGKKYEVSGRKL